MPRLIAAGFPRHPAREQTADFFARHWTASRSLEQSLFTFPIFIFCVNKPANCGQHRFSIHPSSARARRRKPRPSSSRSAAAHRAPRYIRGAQDEGRRVRRTPGGQRRLARPRSRINVHKQTLRETGGRVCAGKLLRKFACQFRQQLRRLGNFSGTHK